MTNPANFHEFRKSGIGASESAAALGLSRRMSRLHLYGLKTNEAQPEAIDDIPVVHFGKLLEPIVLGEYERRTGRMVATDVAHTQIRDTERPWMLAHLDGYVIDGPRVVEAKTARDDRGWGEEGSDDIPQEYLLQVTHQMIVACAEVADIPVLIGGSDFRIYTVARDPELVDLVIAGERQFWEAVQRREPPDPTTLAEVNLRWRTAKSATIELPADAAQAVTRLAELRAGIKESEVEAERHEIAVKKALMFHDVGTIDGVEICTWRQSKPTRMFDSKKFRDENPVVALEYMVEKPGVRRFLLKS